MVEREEIIRKMKERLQWLEQNISENESYADEAEAIRQFLKEMENPCFHLDEEYFSPEKAMERFWSTYETRMEIDREKRRILHEAEARKNSVKEADPKDETKAELSLQEDWVREDNPGSADGKMDSMTDGISVSVKLETSDSGKDGTPDSVKFETSDSVAPENEDFAQPEAEVSGKEGKKGKKSGAEKEKGVFFFLAYHKRFAAIATAAVVVILLMIGSTAGAYANSQMGFFQFLEQDEEGLRAFTAGESTDTGTKCNIKNDKVYKSIDELSEYYRRLLFLPAIIGDKYYIDQITFNDESEYIIFKIDYLTEDDKYIRCTQQYFKNQVSYHSKTFDGFNFLKEDNQNEVKISYFESESKDDKKYVANFFIDNILFNIKGNVSLEELENIVKEILVDM